MEQSAFIALLPFPDREPQDLSGHQQRRLKMVFQRSSLLNLPVVRIRNKPINYSLLPLLAVSLFRYFPDWGADISGDSGSGSDTSGMLLVKLQAALETLAKTGAFASHAVSMVKHAAPLLLTLKTSAAAHSFNALRHALVETTLSTAQ